LGDLLELGLTEVAVALASAPVDGCAAINESDFPHGCLLKAEVDDGHATLLFLRLVAGGTLPARRGRKREAQDRAFLLLALASGFFQLLDLPGS
jgi:hypothetical protein